jgi:hypothetical protein
MGKRQHEHRHPIKDGDDGPDGLVPVQTAHSQDSFVKMADGTLYHIRRA